MQKLVAHFKDGRLLKGHSSDFRPTKTEFHVQVPGEGPTPVSLDELKALFFVKDFEGNAVRDRVYTDAIAGAGRKLRVVFEDGETIIGYAASYSTDRAGFFLQPADIGDNNQRIFVVTSACDQVELV